MDTKNALIEVNNLGSINFGLPENIAPSVKPWEYYRILGVENEASREKINSAYKAWATKLHPDKHIKKSKEKRKELEEKLKLVHHIKDVLLNDTHKIDNEFSNRGQYDTICKLKYLD